MSVLIAAPPNAIRMMILSIGFLHQLVNCVAVLLGQLEHRDETLTLKEIDVMRHHPNIVGLMFAEVEMIEVAAEAPRRFRVANASGERFGDVLFDRALRDSKTLPRS